MKVVVVILLVFIVFSAVFAEEYTATANLKLRTKPCGAVISTLSKGTKVTATSNQKTFDCNYEWIPVKANGKSGFVAFHYLKIVNASPSTSSATISNRPSFSSMWNNYPHDESDALRKAKGLPSYYTNTCAIRLSYALMGSGVTIPSTGFKDKFGKNIHIRVKEIMNYFTKIWGKPELKLKNEKDASKYKGIIVFTNCNFSNAYGHVDVWNGKQCARGCYWDRCSTYHLWQLK